MAVGHRSRVIRRGRTHRKKRASGAIAVFVGMVSDLASKGLDRAGKAFGAVMAGAAAWVAVRTGFHLSPDVAAGIGMVAGAIAQSTSSRVFDTARSEWQKARTAKPGRHRAGASTGRSPPSATTTTSRTATLTKGSGMSLKDELLELIEAARGQYDSQDQTSGLIQQKADEMTQNLAQVGSDEQAQAIDQAKDTAVEAIAQARAAAEKGLDDAVALVHQAIP